MGRGTGLWVNVYDGSTPQPGKVLLFVQKTQRELPPGAEGARGEEAGPGKGTLKVSSCQAYDFILLAALKSQVRSDLQLCSTAGSCAQMHQQSMTARGCRAQWLLYNMLDFGWDGSLAGQQTPSPGCITDGACSTDMYSEVCLPACVAAGVW
jgi:hypothetical protein